MYICICNGVTEGQIRDCVQNHGVHRIGHLKKQLGVCTRCGKCALAAKQTLERCLLEKQKVNIDLDLGSAGVFNYV